MNWLKRVGLAALLAGAAAFGTPTAQAGWVPGMQGWTRVSSPSTSDALVSFAVWAREGADWTADAPFVGFAATSLTGGGVIDTGASYVYLYQVVNDDPVPGMTDPNIRELKVTRPQGSITSMGHFDSAVFTDGAPVGPAVNPTLGADPVSTADDVVDGVPTALFGGAPGLALNGGVNPVAAVLDNVNFQSVFEFGSTEIKSGKYSSLLFYTSNVDPGYGEGIVRDGNDGDGDVPVPTPVPEPSALVLMGLGGLGAFGRWVARRRTPPATA